MSWSDTMNLSIGMKMPKYPAVEEEVLVLLETIIEAKRISQMGCFTVVHEMLSKSQKKFDASRDKLLPVFGVGVTFIDESAICSLLFEISKGIKDIRMIVFDPLIQPFLVERRRLL